MVFKKRILVAPLNWGLGHATRCIPVINALIDNNFTPVIASDGVALSLLQKEFPELESIELPSYKIEYAREGKNFKLKMIWDSPKIIKAISKEKKKLKQIIKDYKIDGIISDNRLGIRSKKVPCVFITHQLNVLTGNTTWFSSKVHQSIIKKFDECWVPDIKEKPNLTGKLGHLKKSTLTIKYLGPLSRLNKLELVKKYDLMIIISGPEPQRTMLEENLLEEIKKYEGKVLFVRGKIEAEQITEECDNAVIYNYMNSRQLETAFNESEYVLSRSGYTTVMDLAKLEKKAFFIPTPGQYEQEYLAERLDKQGLVPYSTQEKFKIKKLKKINDYKGLNDFKTELDFGSLFSLFKSE
ncbi:glycosyltransferase [Abyssalbus ytuae]|uniref:Glycosyltransferase n=1 Tax=Abyssalbus ytuae TaxID=2926907 RepID=A0A9E6ZLA3_9FLAO|nr:glycosyltransferase [Abyssalbus ytuae]UOB16340.1 glycosyltransferase [Abyssalbus ytuae]